jgi:hypothetical protein
MKKPQTVKALEDLGRVRLSKSFFMREFLYSEISQIEGIPNIPDDLELAIEAGRNLCEKVIEPIQDALGRVSVRSAFRSCEVNAKGAEKKNNCANNKHNYAAHIWDRRDEKGYMGATACVIVTSFISYYESTQDWPALAWWIHDNISGYAKMVFFPKYAAFNVSWHEDPEFSKSIYGQVNNPTTGKRGYLTRQGMDNFEGDHSEFYKPFLMDLKPK